MEEVNEGRKKWSRRRFVVASAGIVAGGVGLEAGFLEPKRISVTRHSLGSEPLPGVQPLRLVQLTDLHLRGIGAFEERVAETVWDLAPDVIVLTGDSIDQASSLQLLTDFLSLLPTSPLRFATLGNWEYWSGVDLGILGRVYAQGSCQLLVDETATFSHGPDWVSLVGLDDWVGGSPNLERALEGTTITQHVLLLSHCPGFRDEVGPLANLNPVAMLSGHTHGGQVALGGWAPFRPQGSGRYRAGWYRGVGPDLYVSRGLGTSVLPVRLGSVPEIAYFEWSLEPD